MVSNRPVDIHKLPVDLEFCVFTAAEIKRLSVVQVITGNTFDVLGHSIKGGLYDSAMGSYGRMKEPCTTCYSLTSCPGHLGHIELNALFYNPFFVKIVHRLLNMFCLQCHKLQTQDYIIEIITLQLMLIDAGYIIEAQELEIYKSEAVFQNTDRLVLLEKGFHVHPRIAELIDMLAETPTSEAPVDSKTSHAIRDAIVHAALQRPSNVNCTHCSTRLRGIRYQYRKLVYFMTAAELNAKNPETEATVGQNKVILADECRNHLREVYKSYPDFLKLLFPLLKACNIEEGGDQSPIDIFFMDIIPVTPPKARPTNVVRDHVIEHPQTAIYRNILEDNLVIRVIVKHIKQQTSDISEEAKQAYEIAKGSTSYEKLYHAWQELQNSIDLLLDVSANRSMSTKFQGLKQVLEKKEGLIRKHMMGKRVNYAARTVITPDPNINVDEIGIPDIFAKKLTFPTPVTAWNVAELRRMVINGPKKYPGATYIQDEKGYTTIIPGYDTAKRESMAKLLLTLPENGIKIVHRHLLNGDILLLNRQPSLHKPSIMAHKARILSGEKTFRLHYSNCKAYNADFDGDEMNAHYPQSEVARSEAYNLVNVANNYLVPKDGTPLGGLIQDHVISGVKLSIRGRFFNREDYQQLVFQGLSDMKGDLRLLPPALLKPKTLWSGKQVLSTIILNLIPEGYPRINLNSNAKIQSKYWKVRRERKPLCGPKLGETEMCESEVNIRKGELLTGVLDKQQYGATTYGFIHCMYELYGGEVSTRLLTAFTKVFTYFLQREGFSLGVKDILVSAKADKVRQKHIEECRQIGNVTTASALEMSDVPPMEELIPIIEDNFTTEPNLRSRLDGEYKVVLDRITNAINTECLPNGLITKFPDNNLQLMVLSGAKGSLVNTMQISSLLGQIELEGKRPPLMISCKPLPSFPIFETSPKAGGFIDGRFMTGIQPQDFFFHCMAGREGLIDTAVKTSRSGYLQRCLIKHLEGLNVNYDLTVRDSDNCVVQFLYGEDGLDILKSKFFRWKQAPQFFIKNADVVLRPDEVDCIKDEESLWKVTNHNKKIKSWRKKHKQREKFDKRMLSPFTKFSEDMRDSVKTHNPDELNPKTGRRRIDEKLIKKWRKADEDLKAAYCKKYTPCLDPATASYKQDLYYGSISEQLQSMIDKFRSANDPSAKSLLADVLYLKNMKSLAAPGDPVGLLAAQSIGEPSTQMTLNTFHFAGRGEMNVTLGIPRLREILMLASANIKTPSMEVPLQPGQAKAAQKLRVKLNRVTLSNVLEYVKVNIKLVLEPERAYQYKLHFQFLPRDGYSLNYYVRPKQILKFVSEKFFKHFMQALIKSSRSKRVVVDMNDNEEKKDEYDPREDADLDEGDGFERVKTEKSKSADNEDASTDDEFMQIGDEEDATGTKLRTRRLDEADYDEPDDPDEIGDAKGDSDVEEYEEDEVLKSIGVDSDDSDSEFDEEIDPKMTENVLKNAMVSNYTYDKEKHLWCEITFNFSTKYKKPDISSTLRELADKTVLHQVHNVKRAYIFNEDGREILKTEGINIGELFKYDQLLELNGLYTNDIHAIARTYGIEAAAQGIIKEIKNVFKVYGIEVDRRHLSLIADYMTFDGTFQPMSRKGLQYSASPLQQMSFESCLQFLKNATSFGHKDHLTSPSSRLMVGLPIKNGTGAFDLLTKVC